VAGSSHWQVLEAHFRAEVRRLASLEGSRTEETHSSDTFTTLGYWRRGDYLALGVVFACLEDGPVGTNGEEGEVGGSTTGERRG